MSNLQNSNLSEQQKEQLDFLNSSKQNNKIFTDLHHTLRDDWAFDSYIYYLCLHDERMKVFFEKLSGIGNEAIKDTVVKYLKLFVDSAEKFMVEEKQVDEKLKELEKEGLTITSEYKIGDRMTPLNTKSKFYGLDIGCDRCMDFVSGFNGIRITYDMLLDEGKNKYEIDYQRWKEQNKNLESERETLEELIANKKKKLRFSVTKRASKKDEIATLEKKLNDIILKIKHGDRLKECSMIFSNFTSSQRIKLLDYFKSVSYCVDLANKIEDIVKKIDDMHKSHSCYSDEERIKWSRALEFLLQLTDYDAKNEIEYVNKLILGAFSNERYSVGAYGSSLGSLREVVDWYMYKVYEENRDREETKGVNIGFMRSL